MITQAPQEARIRPFVSDDDVHIGERLVEVESEGVVETAAQQRIGGVKRLDDTISSLLTEIVQAPAIERLEYSHRVSERDELGSDASEKVRAGMVPIRDKRVVEEYEAHGALLGIEPSFKTSNSRTRHKLSLHPYGRWRSLVVSSLR